MVSQKDKDVLLLPVTDGGVTQPFNMSGFPTYDKTKAQHNGLDIGWCTNQYCNILACQDGKVVDILNNNSSCGNGIVLQHDYPDGTHRWTAYIHLKEVPTLKKGAEVKQGDKIGIRGGSPYVNGKAKYGTHLHLYVTTDTNKAYTWNTMKANVIDPYPLLYRSEKVEYNWINSTLSVLPLIEDYTEEIAILKKQIAELQEKLDNIRQIIS